MIFHTNTQCLLSLFVVIGCVNWGRNPDQTIESEKEEIKKEIERETVRLRECERIIQIHKFSFGRLEVTKSLLMEGNCASGNRYNRAENTYQQSAHFLIPYESTDVRVLESQMRELERQLGIQKDRYDEIKSKISNLTTRLRSLVR